jgi:hypothetical protein
VISTYGQVRSRALARLDDPSQATFTDAILLPGIQEAIDVLFEAFVFFEIPRVKVVTTFTVGVGTTSVTPATAGIADMGEIIELRERLSGSTDRYVHIHEVDDLPQRDAVECLGNWEWRGDAFYFVGATTARQVWISYFSTTTQESSFDANASTGVDGALNFLSLYAVSAVGGRKGYNEIAEECRRMAVGNRFDDGVIGGSLFRLCQPMVRARQRVQVAPRAYSITRRLTAHRAAPYIAAQQPAGVGTAPVQFSTATGTITGTLDGVNTTFYLSYPVSTARVFLNGAAMTATIDYTHSVNVITFLAGQIPQASDTITVEGYL